MSVTAGARPFPLAMKHFYSFVPHACHWWCPPCWCPFSVGHVAFLFICLPGLSLPVSVHAAFLFIHQVCHCWCPPLSLGHAAFLFMCLPGLSLVVWALFRWPSSISIPGLSLVCPCLLSTKHFCSFVLQVSIHLSFRSVTGGVRPCPLAMKHFHSFVSHVRYCWCPSVGHVAFLFICLPSLSLLVSALFRRQCNISIH